MSEKLAENFMPKELNFKSKFRNWFVYIVLIVLVLVFALLNKRFATLENFMVIGRQSAVVAVLAFGMTFVITAAEIDLSIGSTVALSGMITAMLLVNNAGIVLSSMAGIAAGLIIGFINGIITAKLRIPSFLVTLGTAGIARGIALTLTGTKTVVLYDERFGSLWGSGTILGLPASVLWVVFFLVFSVLVYNYTRFGNYVKATGGNRVAARYTGINTDKVTIMVLAISGLLAGVAGLMMVSRINAGRPEVGADFALDAVTAVILGGTRLFGGKGSIINSLVGALIIGVITNALVILGIQSNIQMIIKGAIVIAAVSVSEKN